MEAHDLNPKCLGLKYFPQTPKEEGGDCPNGWQHRGRLLFGMEYKKFFFFTTFYLSAPKQSYHMQVEM